MTITLTFTAETPSGLKDQLQHYISATNHPGPVLGEGEGEAASPTNDDYRRAIMSIPRGRVAPYSVVSEVVRGDTAGSQKVAGLAANDGTLGTAYRVVKKDGSIAAGFRWTDGRMGGHDEGRRALEDEGVGFDIHGRALREFMLSAADLRTYYEA